MKFRHLYEGKKFYYALDDKVAKKELMQLNKTIDYICSQLKKGMEFPMDHWNDIQSFISKIEKSVYKNVAMAEELTENEMKFQALAMAKDLHNQLAGLTFIDMLAVMSSNNPAKKEVQDLETKVNALTTEVGSFIQKYIPDVADADVGDTEEYAEPEEEPKEPKAEKPAPKKAKPAVTDKEKNKKIKDNEEEIKEDNDMINAEIDELIEALEVKLRGGKVPVGQHRFKYDVDKSDKYIENSIKERDPKATVERKGKDLWVTASAGAHSSVIASMRRFRVEGTISEALEEGSMKRYELIKKAAKKIDREDKKKAAAAKKDAKKAIKKDKDLAEKQTFRNTFIKDEL